MTQAVVVRDLRKRYGTVEAVRGVSFEVSSGAIFGLLGPNGAGKTSTLECVLGLRTPDSGTISVGGIDAIAHPHRVKEIIGAQLQSTALQDQITPREALRLFAAFYAKPFTPAELIERFALAEKADDAFSTLSGGQKQRLALALAFVNRPQVIFLDEPTTGLDPQSRRDLHRSILQMRADGHTVVLTTHYIEEAQHLCDQIAIIDHGKVIADGKPSELVASAKTLPRIRFRATRRPAEPELTHLGAVVRVDPSSEDGSLQLQTQNVSQTTSDLVGLLHRDNNELLDLQVVRPSLEDVFIELTGTRLRD